MRKATLALAVAVCLPSVVVAQSGEGAGGFSPNPRVSVEYLSSWKGRPPTTHLRAIVAFRGRPYWGNSWNPEEAAAVRDSFAARQAVRTFGRSGGGTCIPRRCAFAELDVARDSVYVMGNAFHAPDGDSTLILLVDDVDQDVPGIESFSIPSIARITATIGGEAAEHTRRESRLDQVHFFGILTSSARLREFIGPLEYHPVAAEPVAAPDAPRR